jgi:hypothetical protein
MSRNTYVLFGILALLVVVAYLVMQKPGERSSAGESGEYLVSVDSLSVDKIEIKSSASSVVLEKKGVEWFVTAPVSYRADQSVVATLIHDSKVLEVKNIVSNKPEKYAVFQVDSTGTQVRVFEKGTEKSSFIIGKSGGSYSEMYARRMNSNDVALVSGTSSYVFTRPLKEWRDRTILNAPREGIKEVKYQFGDTTFVLAYRDSAWTIGKDSTQDYVVSNLLSSLSNVQADDFVDTLTTHPPKPTAQISYAGTQLTFFYVKEGDKYLVQSSGLPQRFEMQSWHANQVLKRKKELTKSGK